MQRAALKVLIKDFPTAAQGATCAVMRAAVGKMLPFLRLLQLYGGDCPEIAEANAVMTQAFEGLAKAVLSRPHAFRDLECFYGALRAGMLGSQADAMEQAIQAAVDEAIAKDAGKSGGANGPK